ncbi:hypothetical protein ABBQ38_005382 [Trebouxia sp. C0009 RCD-2024]
MVAWGDIRRQTMTQLGSAAELKEALNCLSPEDAWGNRADVDEMFLDGFTSLKHMATVQPDLLQRYGVPPAQTGTLQQLAEEAVAEGHVIFVIKSQYDEFELPLKTWKNRILLESLQKQLEMHKPPLRPKSINNVPISVRHNDRTLQVKLHNGQRLEVEAEPLPGFEPFIAYPQAFSIKRLLSSWIYT